MLVRLSCFVCLCLFSVSFEPFRHVVPIPCCANPEGNATKFPGIRGYISVMAVLQFTYLLIERNNVLLKIIAERLYKWLYSDT
jgi:hypothetical protein